MVVVNRALFCFVRYTCTFSTRSASRKEARAEDNTNGRAPGDMTSSIDRLQPTCLLTTAGAGPASDKTAAAALAAIREPLGAAAYCTVALVEDVCEHAASSAQKRPLTEQLIVVFCDAAPAAVAAALERMGPCSNVFVALLHTASVAAAYEPLQTRVDLQWAGVNMFAPSVECLVKVIPVLLSQSSRDDDSDEGDDVSGDGKEGGTTHGAAQQQLGGQQSKDCLGNGGARGGGGAGAGDAGSAGVGADGVANSKDGDSRVGDGTAADGTAERRRNQERRCQQQHRMDCPICGFPDLTERQLHRHTTLYHVVERNVDVPCPVCRLEGTQDYEQERHYR
jgi:hypothetical protein